MCNHYMLMVEFERWVNRFKRGPCFDCPLLNICSWYHNPYTLRNYDFLEGNVLFKRYNGNKKSHCHRCDGVHNQFRNILMEKAKEVFEATGGRVTKVIVNGNNEIKGVWTNDDNP